MTRLIRPALALSSLVLLTACDAPPECPDGLRLEGEVCVVPGGSLSGTAGRAGDGAPAHGIQVALLGTDRVAVTDDGGGWAMASVPPGTYALAVTADGYRPERVEDVAVADGGHTRVDPVLLEAEAVAATVTGVVRGADAKAAEGAVVFLERTGHVTITDAYGAFRLPGVAAGAYTLVVRHESHLTLRRSLSVAEQDAVVDLQPIVLEAVEVPAPEEGAVSGRITLGAGGAGAAGVQVYLEGTPHAAFTDASGGFVLEGVPTGTYVLGAALPDHQVARVTGVTVVQGETTDVGAVVLAPAYGGATVAGVVREPGGVTASGAVVFLEGTDHVALTDPAGAYALAGVEAGVYTLAVRQTGYEVHRVTVSVGAADVTVTVAPVDLVPVADPAPTVGILTGKIVFAATGAPAPGVQVYVEGTAHAASSGADGLFRIGEVPVGTWALGAALPGYRVVRVSGLKVLEDLKTDAGTLALKPVVEPVTGTVSGSVRLFGLAAHDGITVTLEGPDGSKRTSSTEVDGAYMFTDLTEGLYRVGFVHPPWQPAERVNLGVAAGDYVVEDVTLRLGRRIDDRVLVEAVPVVDTWVMAWFEGAAAPVLLDTAGGRRIALPAGTVQALAADLDHVLLLVNQPVLEDHVVQVVDVDLPSGQTRPVASQPSLSYVHSGGVVYADADRKVWAVGLDGALPGLVAPPPCSGATVSAINAGPAPGWLRIGWTSASCAFAEEVWKYYRPTDGALSPLILVEARLVPGHVLAIAHPADTGSLGPWLLCDLDLVSGHTTTVFSDVEDMDLGVPTLVQRSGPTDDNGPVWQVDPATLATTELLADGRLYVRFGSGAERSLLLKSVTPDALWGFARPAGTLTQLCAAPYSMSHTGGEWITCREGSQALFTLSVHHVRRGLHRVMTSTADWSGSATGEAGGIVWRSGDWSWAATGESGSTRGVCNGNLNAHAISPDGRHGVFLCESWGVKSLRHVDLETGTSHEVLPNTAAVAPTSLWCQLGGEGGDAVVCDYDCPPGLDAAWFCGDPNCTVAYSASDDRRLVFPGDGGSWVVWGRYSHGMAMRSPSYRRHVTLSGPSPLMALLSSVDFPLAIGDWGGASLWRTTDRRTVMVFVDGRMQTVDYSDAEPLNLPGTDVWLTTSCMADLSAQRCLASQYDIYERTLTEDGQALTWRDGIEYWRYAWVSGRTLLASNVERFEAASRYYWDEDTAAGLGSVYRRDPQTGALELVAEEVDPFRLALGGDRWMVFVDPRPGTDQTYLAYVAGAEGPFTVAARQASLATLPWLDPDVAPRVAFNGWTAEGLRLRVAELDGSAVETLGPAAVDARIAEGDGRVSFASDGVWWHESAVPESATPVDVAASLQAPLAFSPDGSKVVYAVDGAGRRGTWLAVLP